MSESLNQRRISDIDAPPQIEKHSDKIREKISSLNLPPDLALQAEWTLNKMIQRETKGGDTLKTPDQRTYSVDELLANIQTAEQVKFLIQHENERALREEITVRENTEDANKPEKLRSWRLLNAQNLENWKNGNKIPKFFNEGDFVAVANIPNMMSQNNESDLYYCWGKTMPELPIGVLGEVEYYQLLKKGEPLRPIGRRQSLTESSDRLLRKVIGEPQETTRSNTLITPPVEPLPQNERVVRPDQKEKKDTKIEPKEGTLLLYRNINNPLEGINKDVFRAHIVGIEENGDFIVESLDDSKRFIISRDRWNELTEEKNRVLGITENIAELNAAYQKALKLKKDSQTIQERRKNIEKYADNKQILLNTMERYLDEFNEYDVDYMLDNYPSEETSTVVDKRIPIQNLAEHIAGKIVGDTEKYAQEFKDLKEKFSIMLSLFGTSYTKEKLLDIIWDDYLKFH